MDDTPPVNVGETYDVSINAVGGKGDGIARIRGFVVFVPGVQQGDSVKIRITKVLPKVGFAEVVGKADLPPREQKYATVSKDELEREKEAEQSQKYEDTEDFGEGQE